MAERAGDVLFSSGVGTSTSGNDMRVVEMWEHFFSQTRADAGRITGITMTRPSGTLMGLVQVPPVAGKAWGALMALPTLDARLDALRDPSRRAALIAEGEQKGLWYDANHVYPLGADASPDYNIVNGQSVGALAAAAGVSPIELIVNRLLESDGRELVSVWFFNRHTEALAEFLRLDGIVPGLGDAGAHAGSGDLTLATMLEAKRQWAARA